MPDDASQPAPQGQFLIYADGASQLRVRLDGNTIWLTQKLIAERYGVSVKTVNEPLVNIYSEAELPPEATIRNFRIVQREGTRNVEHYSLDAILAVGYRVRSACGTAFRQWAATSYSGNCWPKRSEFEELRDFFSGYDYVTMLDQSNLLSNVVSGKALAAGSFVGRQPAASALPLSQ